MGPQQLDGGQLTSRALWEPRWPPGRAGTPPVYNPKMATTRRFVLLRLAAVLALAAGLVLALPDDTPTADAHEICTDTENGPWCWPHVHTASTPTAAGIAARDELVAAQEALLNTYRCRFGIDTQIVPGGCKDGKPATPAPTPAPDPTAPPVR